MAVNQAHSVKYYINYCDGERALMSACMFSMLGLLQASVLAGCVLLSSLTHYLHWASAELPSRKAVHQLLFEGAVVREVLLM